MVVRLTKTIIESIDDTDTKRLKLIRIVSKDEGAVITLELPEVLCETLKANDAVAVTMDKKEMKKGEKSKLYMEGKVFRTSEGDDLNVIATAGGLRLTVSISKPTAAQKTTFDTDKLFFVIQ
ncbi:hypothetical protein EU528_14740 [Candidatus Thorarchaeota archaeon]|nr:MAG: hypothetical protein EU528_14740 [Candidatus Thorarchaeota archaeon]